jgi:hypothetical protein
MCWSYRHSSIRGGRPAPGGSGPQPSSGGLQRDLAQELIRAALVDLPAGVRLAFGQVLNTS